MIQIRYNSFQQPFQNQMRRMPSYLSNWILLVICVYIGFKVYSGYEGDFRPQGVHFWAQADRFSIARNYYDNGLNFFNPQTNYLEYSNGSTGVEFPLVQYLTAVIAKIFGGRDSLFLIYRILSFAILITGLQFLLNTIRMHGGNGFQQILIPAFVLLSPVLLFYGFNLIPDTSSLALILISYHYFEKFRLKLHYNAIYIAIAWGCFASLLKLTSAIFPVAYLVWFIANALFIDKLISRNQIFKVLLAFIISFGISLGINYYFTVIANAKFNSSVFLSTSRHINQLTDFSDIWENVVCWHREYFRETQYWVLLVAFVSSIAMAQRSKEVLLYKGILVLGSICFILLMGKQLMHHDYYAICTIIPLVLMLSIDGLMVLTTGCFGSLILLYIVVNLAPHSLNQSKLRQNEVYNIPCREIWDFRGYMVEGADWIEKNKVPVTAKVFVLYDFPLNTPLVYFDRKGMVINHYKMTNKQEVDTWFALLKPEYVAIPNQWKADFERDRPDILSTLTQVYLGKQVIIYKTTQSYLP